MGYNGVPPRWEEYSNIGRLIPGTAIIPFKVPLRKEICRNLSNPSLSFTVEDLLNHCKDINLSMIIDLTQTKRFYDGENLKEYNIEHVKLSTRGGGCMPNDFEVKKFCDIIDNHLKKNPDAVIGVHCTHGLNRTGYFICRYMIDRLGFLGSDSVNLFEECRGHEIDRENYRNFLMKKNPKRNISDSSNKNDDKDYTKFQHFKKQKFDQCEFENSSPLRNNNKATSSAGEFMKYETVHNKDMQNQPFKFNKCDRFDSDKRNAVYNNNYHKNLSKYSNDDTRYGNECNYRSYKDYKRRQQESDN